MVDEFKSIRDNLFKAITSFNVSVKNNSVFDDDNDTPRNGGRETIDAGAARALIAALFTKAGKGKDEIVQIVAREIGVAVAAMLKEPLSQLAKHQKLQISFEFAPKVGIKSNVTSQGEGVKTPKRPTRKKNSRARKKKI